MITAMLRPRAAPRAPAASFYIPVSPDVTDATPTANNGAEKLNHVCDEATVHFFTVHTSGPYWLKE